MLRKLSVAVAAVAALGLTALPASAATASHPKPHAFSIPDATGVKAWGSFLKSGHSVKVTVCVKITSRSIAAAAAAGVAFNSAGKGKPVTATATGFGHGSCRSMTTTYTTHLFVDSGSATVGGKVNISKVRRVY